MRAEPRMATATSAPGPWRKAMTWRRRAAAGLLGMLALCSPAFLLGQAPRADSAEPWGAWAPGPKAKVLLPALAGSMAPAPCEAAGLPAEVVSVGAGSVVFFIVLLLSSMVFGRSIAGFLDNLDNVE
ncbi:unnamed protein product [Symbiodinium natans]|uniref:Uncharacterized protein n=1 Tax=Symbiodinium natans TaxID=878477 RepID=A0A812V0R0_9DINO|nr:unnamed protein product [Symbiodinium natans]